MNASGAHVVLWVVKEKQAINKSMVNLVCILCDTLLTVLLVSIEEPATADQKGFRHAPVD